jgi:DNA polymerase-3 subunit gamma/tau
MSKTTKKTDTKNTESNQQQKALYTKYRPQKFSDVLGQEHVVSVIKDTIKNGNISHAYLFAGSRGTGKTSIARILAQEIGTTNRDLYEIDAASNNSVEDIRELNESVSTLPYDSKYKVFILDEVHMLSKSAFNALLKTLEEPPAHIIFILATTEPEKIPETVISRCESYSFKTPNRTILKKMAIKVAEKEGFEIDPAGAELISILGDGSFRDTHTTLQKLIRSSSDKKISLEEIEKVLEAPKSELINNFIKAIAEKDIEVGLSIIKESQQSNIDAKFFLKILMERVRVALMIKIGVSEKNYKDIISEEDQKKMSEILEADSDSKINSKLLVELIDTYEKTMKSYMPYLPLEILLIEKSQ